MIGTVLVIEDDQVTAEFVREALQYEGYGVLRAVDGAGLAKAIVERPDLVLLDVNMPGMNGP